MTPNDSNPSILGPNQRRLVGFTVSFACLLGVIFLFSLTIAILGRLVSTFSSMLWPLAVAGILALMLRPLVLRGQLFCDRPQHLITLVALQVRMHS